MSKFWMWIQRRNSVRSDVISSIVDQGLLSGGSIFATGILAYSLHADEFGKFTIAWAMAVLFESALLKPLLDDPLPSVAVCTRGSIAQLRSSFLLWSMIAAGAIGGLAIVLGMIWAALGLDNSLLFATAGLVIVACRLQNAMRRIFYLDRRLRLVVCGAMIYFATLTASLAIMIKLQQISAATAMLCISLSSAAAFSFSFALVRRKDLTRPTMKMFVWSFRMLTESGRWIAAAGLAFWAGSVGVIPVAGIFLGGAAGGSLRILFLLFAPLGQLNIALLAMMIPRAAVSLRVQGASTTKQMAIEKTLIFGSLSAAYGLCAVLCGFWLIPAKIFPDAYGITIVEISWMAAAMTFEGVWAGLALPLYATAQTKRFLASRVIAVPFLLTLFPLATWMWGIAGTVAAIAVSSAASAMLLAVTLASVRADFDPSMGGSTTRVVHPEVA